MSRRESRASMGTRHADALAEYENLKKKFLLANKHITKLNSTLSIRIEELNTEITFLQVENLRLRQSEISLQAQLKREREKTRRVLSDTEAVTLHLTKHLSYLRHTLHISSEPTPPLSPAFPPAIKPSPQTINACIPGLRISKPPNFPGIHEEEEPCASSSDNGLEEKPSSTKRKSKSKSRLSASKLPLPARATSPPANASSPLPNMRPTPTRVDYTSSSSSGTNTIGTSSKRKSSRRQSGLLIIDTENLAPPRPASPAFGSPIRLEAGRAEEAEEIAVWSGNLEVDAESEHELLDYEQRPQSPLPPVPKKEKRRSKSSKDKEMTEVEKEKEYAVDSMRSREKKRHREDDGDLPLQGTKGKLRDVSNSRVALQSIDPNIGELTVSVSLVLHSGYLTTATAIRVQPAVRDQEEVVVSARTFLVSSPTSSSTIPSALPLPPPPPEFDPEPAPEGRERRARKSVNYAEPKLNTKMRKPDPPPGTEQPPSRSKKRSSAAAVMTTQTYPKIPEPPPPVSMDGVEHRRSSGELRRRNDDDDEVRPELYPLPPSRPSSALYHTSPTTLQHPTSTGGTISSSSSSGGASTGSGSVRRKKSKPLVDSEDEGSDDGAQADAEYVPSGRSGAWVNVEGRSRRSAGERTRRPGLTMFGGSGETRRDVAGEERRHSMAV